MRTIRRHVERPPVAPIVSLTALFALFVVPMCALAVGAFWTTLHRDLDASFATSVFGYSIICSVAATAVSLALGLPIAWKLARRRFGGRNIVRTLCIVPMIVPPVIVGSTLVTMLFRDRLLDTNLLGIFGMHVSYRAAALIGAEAFVSVPFVIIVMTGAFVDSDRCTQEAAADLGAGRWMTFRQVVLPSIRPSLVVAGVLCWARSIGEFGATLTFAANIQGRTRILSPAMETSLRNDPVMTFAMSAMFVAVSATILVTMRGQWMHAIGARTR